MADQKDVKPDISSLLPNNLGSRPRLNNMLSTKISPGISRLPSFKAPRDLTLSSAAIAMRPQIGLSRPKKTFVPNIPIKREKNDKLPESKSERSLRKSPLKGRQQGRGKFVKKEKEYFQTKGSLFGEGVAAASMKRQNYVGSTKVGSGKDQAYIQKPVLNHSAAANVDKDEEEKKLRELMRDDFIDDPDDELDLRLKPIELPMIPIVKAFKGEPQIKHDVDVCNVSKNLLDVRIKEEPVEAEVQAADNLKQNPVKQHDRNNASLTEEFESILPETNSNEFMLFQLPSCLPGHPPEIKQEPAHHNLLPKKSTTTNTSSDVSTNQQCTLSTLPEGRIGTIKIYESGKTELWLGDHIMTLRKGAKDGFLQEVVKMAVDNEAKTGSMAVLGHIKHRLVCTPNFDHMVKEL